MAANSEMFYNAFLWEAGTMTCSCLQAVGAHLQLFPMSSSGSNFRSDAAHAGSRPETFDSLSHLHFLLSRNLAARFFRCTAPETAAAHLSLVVGFTALPLGSRKSSNCSASPEASLFFHSTTASQSTQSTSKKSFTNVLLGRSR